MKKVRTSISKHLPELVLLLIVGLVAGFVGWTAGKHEARSGKAEKLVEVANFRPENWALCEDLKAYLAKLDLVSDYYNKQLVRHEAVISPDTANATFRKLLSEANMVNISLPTSSASAEAKRIYSLIRDYQVAWDRLGASVRDGTNISNTDAVTQVGSTQRELNGYRRALCPPE